jgi:hypothetical protein
MVDSRAKGARNELVCRNKLRELTSLEWERVPSSGALGEQHKLKGDLYLPGEHNIYCIEVKAYKDEHFNSKILTAAKSNNWRLWWAQTIRESAQVDKKPILIFKYDRSKWFMTSLIEPTTDFEYFKFSNGTYTALLEDYIHSIEEWIK